MARLWTEAEIGSAVRILGKHHFVREALLEIENALCREVSRRQLRKAFTRRGLGNPVDYLKAEETTWGEITCEQVDEEWLTNELGYGISYEPPKRQNWRVLLVPDTHVPFEDKAAWRLLIKFAKEFEPDQIVVMGDFADFYSVSSHSKDPERVSQLKTELDAVSLRLSELEDIGAKALTYIEGNHEERLQRYLKDKAPALFSLLSYPQIMQLEERGWQWVPYREHIKLGKIYLTHDVGSGGPGAHNKAGQAFEHSVAIGHCHRLAATYWGNAVGESHVSASLGWLGSVEACDYMHSIRAKRDWSHGWGTLLIDGAGDTHLQLHPVINGKVRLGEELLS